MLNDINKSVYLPKMVPLKWGCNRVWGVRGVWGYYDNIKGEKEGTPTWDNTYQMKLCTYSHTFIVGGGRLGSYRGDGTNVLFKLECRCVL